MSSKYHESFMWVRTSFEGKNKSILSIDDVRRAFERILSSLKSEIYIYGTMDGNFLFENKKAVKTLINFLRFKWGLINH